MNRFVVWAALGVIALGSSGYAAVRLSVKAEMKQVVEPASNTVFAVGGEVDPANGPDAKATPARWAEAVAASKRLQAVAAGLSQRGRTRPGADWPVFVKQMADLSAKATAAAAAHDGAAFSQAANDLSDNCAACHTKYKPQTGD